ncbi:MAG: FAD-binding and (Fe-S)-binding domain-containing protein [Phycisphaerales bacterium]
MTSSTVDVRIDASAIRDRHERGMRARVRGDVRFGHHDRMLYATDASMYQVEPLGVIIPADVDDAVAAVGYAAEHGLPILPRGGGTSLAGQCVAEAIVLDLSAECRALLEVADDRTWCRVEAGRTIQDLNDALESQGVFFAPDPSTVRQAVIGGVVGNNAAGTRSVRYGRTAENLRGVDVCLAGGTVCRLDRGAAARDTEGGPVRRLTDRVIEIVDAHADLIRERFPRTVRRNAGYALDMILAQMDDARAAGRDPRETVNLAHLICGAEGTLAVTLAAEVDLHPLPGARGLATLGFASMDEAIAAVEPMLTLDPSAVELLDDLIVGLARRNREYARYVDLMPQPPAGELEAVLYVEFWESDAAAVRERFAALEAVAAALPGSRPGMAAYDDPAAIAQALKLRSAGEPLLHGIPGHRKPIGFVEDNAVPVERLGEFVREFRALVESHGTRASFYAHASVGVLHVRPLLDLRDAGDRERMEDIAVRVAALAKRLGGVMSGEHGDGRARGPLLEDYFGPELMDAFRQVKHAFDPDGRLNTGNIVDPQPVPTIHASLRVRPDDVDLPPANVPTWFAFRGEGGYDHAVELCNGAGVCRKNSGGTMCPSYRATRDERHSTRGRGNALRLAVTGQAGRPGQAATGAPPVWNDPETMDTLDLCLSCKACKSECPSNVDVAAYKAEYLAQSWAERGGPPLAARVFGHVRALNRLGSAFAPVSNWVAGAWPVRRLNDRLLGLSRHRALPRFAVSLHRRLAAGRSGRSGGAAAAAALPADAPAVVLYADCFSTYNEPEIGLAAVRVLAAFGYRAVVPSVGCCGRPPISTGLLDVAADCRGRAADVLAAAVAEHDAAAVLVLEPSCLSAITDDWLDLRERPGGEVPDPARLADLAARSTTVEDFLTRDWDGHPRRPSFAAPVGRVVLHGHCHQKALWGTAGTIELLRRIAGDAAAELETGCCGMAGSFGYLDRRYDVSMAVGEESLFPKVRELAAGDTVVAPGTSCRHQVLDGTGRTAVHPVVFAAGQIAAEVAS